MEFCFQMDIGVDQMWLPATHPRCVNGGKRLASRKPDQSVSESNLLPDLKAEDFGELYVAYPVA